jgi:hypothetical protein
MKSIWQFRRCLRKIWLRIRFRFSSNETRSFFRAIQIERPLLKLLPFFLTFSDKNKKVSPQANLFSYPPFSFGIKKSPITARENVKWWQFYKDIFWLIFFTVFLVSWTVLTLINRETLYRDIHHYHTQNDSVICSTKCHKFNCYDDSQHDKCL